MNPSLIDLLKFTPKDETENIVKPGETVIQEYMETTKSHWTGGNYWLGGQIKLSPSEKITDEMLKKVTEIYANPSSLDCCNSWEYASIMTSMRNFFEMDAIIKRYVMVQKRRIMEELHKTPLNTDVNELIMSML
jgi:hypothetical protein